MTRKQLDGKIINILKEYPIGAQISKEINAMLSSYDLSEKPDNYLAPKILMAAALMRIAESMLMPEYLRQAKRLTKI